VLRRDGPRVGDERAEHGGRLVDGLQTMKRITEFMRPCSRSGVIACRRLSCVTL